MIEIPGRPGYYATERGAVWSAHVHRELKQRIGMGGYMAVSVKAGRTRSNAFVHTLICTAYHGPRPEGMVVRHLNGDKYDNRPENLAWGTKSQNSLDRVTHGRHHNTLKTHCPRGHAYEGDNVYVNPRGERHCRTCRREARAVEREARRHRDSSPKGNR